MADAGAANGAGASNPPAPPQPESSRGDGAGPSTSTAQADGEDASTSNVMDELLLKVRLHPTAQMPHGACTPMREEMPPRPACSLAQQPPPPLLLLQEFFSDLRDVDRDNEVNRCAA